MANPPKTRDWNAFENHMPPIGPQVPLNVSGTVTLGKLSDMPHLTEADPQGITPTELILDLTIDTSGIGGAQENEKLVSFHKRVGAGQYQTVMIRWEGEKLATMRVRIVS